jgi:hypothetical protein
MLCWEAPTAATSAAALSEVKKKEWLAVQFCTPSQRGLNFFRRRTACRSASHECQPSFTSYGTLSRNQQADIMAAISTWGSAVEFVSENQPAAL